MITHKRRSFLMSAVAFSMILAACAAPAAPAATAVPAATTAPAATEATAAATEAPALVVPQRIGLCHADLAAGCSLCDPGREVHVSASGAVRQRLVSRRRRNLASRSPRLVPPSVGGTQGAYYRRGDLATTALIVVALAALNLEHVVFSLMSGIRPEQRSANDLSYGIVTALAFFSFLASPFLLVAYLWLAYRARAA